VVGAVVVVVVGEPLQRRRIRAAPRRRLAVVVQVQLELARVPSLVRRPVRRLGVVLVQEPPGQDVELAPDEVLVQAQQQHLVSHQRQHSALQQRQQPGCLAGTWQVRKLAMLAATPPPHWISRKCSLTLDAMLSQ